MEGLSDHLRVLLDSFLTDFHCLGSQADDLARAKDQSCGLGLPDANDGSREASRSVVDIGAISGYLYQVEIFDA